MQDAEHGKGDGQEEEVHCHLAKRLGLKSEAVEPSGKGVFAEVEKSRIAGWQEHEPRLATRHPVTTPVPHVPLTCLMKDPRV